MKMSIVVPCFNEEKNIPLILEKFARCIPPNDLEVVLVNNGSTDGSKVIMDQLLPLYPFARVVNVKINKGYGYGILQGLKTCDCDYLGWTHADMQTDPNDVIRALEIVKCHEDEKVFIKGFRIGRSWWDNLFTAGMSVFESLYLRKFLNEINAQPTVFPKSFFETWKDPPSDFSLDLYALYLARIRGLKIIRFSVKFPKRIFGKSSWNTGISAKCKFIKRTIIFSRNLKKRGIK